MWGHVDNPDAPWRSAARCDHAADPKPLFLTIAEVAVELACSPGQVRALLWSGALLGIQIGGQRTWRIERVRFEGFIESAYRSAEGHRGPRSPGEIDTVVW